MKRCICHFVKWQIHPFISNGTVYAHPCLQVGDTFHFDVFHVERYPCSSTFFLETQMLSFYQDNSTGANSTDVLPPTDYFVYVFEDFHLNGILAELELTDVYSTGPNYDLTITEGKGLNLTGNLHGCRL